MRQPSVPGLPLVDLYLDLDPMALRLRTGLIRVDDAHSMVTGVRDVGGRRPHALVAEPSPNAVFHQLQLGNEKCLESFERTGVGQPPHDSHLHEWS